MALRILGSTLKTKMQYFPKSQIKPNLYTNGEEFVYKKNLNLFYTGYYYELSTGKKYTGKDPNNGVGIELIPAKDDVLKTSLDSDAIPPTLSNTPSGANVINLVELDLQGDDELYYYDSVVVFSYPPLADFQRRLLPSPYYSSPTGTDISVGEYRRYFAKKTNELIYIEISKETYTKFKSNDPTVASDLYECLYLPWSLEGEEEVNRKIVALVERDNKWYGFTSYFRGRFG